jgi:hypothetical protein
MFKGEIRMFVESEFQVLCAGEFLCVDRGSVRAFLNFLLSQYPKTISNLKFQKFFN